MKAPGTDLFLELTEELLEGGNQVRFRAEGGSMHPAIRGGEAVIVEPLLPGGPKKGDICLYRGERGLLAHRLVRTDGPVFIMRGDPARCPEEPVAPHQILGRVVAVERQGRRVGLTGWRAGVARHLYALASRVRGLTRPSPDPH